MGIEPRGRALVMSLGALLFAQPAVAQATQSAASTARQALCDSGGTDGRLLRTLEAITAEPTVARAHWGVAVVGSDGRCLLARDAGQFFHPASTAKLLTTASAMDLLGTTRVTTRLEARGPVVPATQGSGQVLTGDLALVGAGDGSFATADVPWTRPAPATPATAAAPPTPVGLAPAKGMEALEAMADAVRTAGIRQVDGDIVGDDGQLVWEPYGEDWAQDDLLWGYGAPVSALSVHDNQIRLGVRPGAAEGDPAVVETEPGMPAWWSLNAGGLRTGLPGSGTHIAMDRVPGQPRTLRVWGAIAMGAPELTEELSIEEPALYAAEALRGMLLARGVEVTGVARAVHRLPQATAGVLRQAAEPLGAAGCCAGDGCSCPGSKPMSGSRVLAEAASPTVAEDVLATNKESLNLHAELLLQRLGLLTAAFALPAGTSGGAFNSALPERTATSDPAAGRADATATPQAVRDAGSRAEGIRVVRSVLARAGIDGEDVVLVDGSGLSTHDLVTPRAMAALLLWAARQPWYAAWRASLPVGGVDGTLRSRFASQPLQGKLAAKTGTLGESRALVGLLRCASGKEVIVSLFADAHTPGNAADRQAMDRIIEAIYRAE